MYDSHERAYYDICATYGINPHSPPSEPDLCLVMAAYCLRHKITTLKVFTSALNHLSQERWSCDLPRGRLYHDTRTGLENYYGDRNVASPKRAIVVDDLRAFRAVLDLNYFENARDWCACLLAFFGLLRIGEYMDSGLRFSHVQSTPYGLDITIPFSKTSRVPAIVTLAARTDELCPALAFATYVAFFPSLGLPCHPHSPLFITRLHDRTVIQPMSEAEFISRVRSFIATAFPGRDTTRYAGHSFRRGGATALQLAGVPPSIIQRQGRWSSDTFRRYIDADSNPAIRLIATRALLSSPRSDK
jgi:hypothetical protein